MLLTKKMNINRRNYLDLPKKKKKPPESLACYKEGHLNTTEKSYRFKV